MDILTELIQDNLSTLAIVGVVIGLGSLTFVCLLVLELVLSKMSELLLSRFLSSRAIAIYQQTISTYKKWLRIVSILIPIDIVLLIVPKPDILKYIEFVIGVAIAIIIGWLGSRLFEKFFEGYLRESATKRKINGEILVVINFLADIVIFVIIILIFAEVHKINLLGVIASLGLGGLAIAFALNKLYNNYLVEQFCISTDLL